MRRYHKTPGWLMIWRGFLYVLSIVAAILIAWGVAIVFLGMGV